MPISEARVWKKVSIAIVLLVITRGVFVLCVLPPFEGWDEFSHISYFVYLKEHKELPRLGSSYMPESMAPMLRGYPHPWGSWSMTGTNGWGAREYGDFWDRQPNASEELRQIPIYEAAQPPLYYLIASPCWVLFSRLGDLSGIYALRCLNVLFLGAAVFVFLQTLATCVSNFKHRVVIGLLVGLCPLFVITAARVSNDALAILFGSLTLFFLVRAVGERVNVPRWFMLGSITLGLGILTKANDIRKINVIAGLKTLALSVVLLILILCPLYLYHYRASHEFYRHAGILYSHIGGQSTLWVWSHFFHVGWSTHLREWLFTRELWESGWSDIKAPTWLAGPYRIFLYGVWFTVVLSGLRRGWRRRLPTSNPEYLFSNDGYLFLFGVAVLSMLAGLAYFATMCLANWGFVFVTPSYFMIVLPAWSAILYQAALLVGRKFAVWSAGILMAFYILAELFGTLYIMPQAFTATNWSVETWHRLASIHPVFPGPWFVIPSLLIMMALAIYILRTMLHLDDATGSSRNLRESIT
jgi:hypothetical protein